MKHYVCYDVKQKKNNIDKSDKSYTKYNPSFVKKKTKTKLLKHNSLPNKIKLWKGVDTWKYQQMMLFVLRLLVILIYFLPMLYVLIINLCLSVLPLLLDTLLMEFDTVPLPANTIRQ